MAYDRYDFKIQPNSTAMREARQYRVANVKTVRLDIDHIKAHILAGQPVVVAAMVESWWLDKKNSKSVWDQFHPYNAPKGSHAMLVVGWSETVHALKVRNAFGEDWGISGYGWISYDHFLRCTHELYVTADFISGGDPVAEIPRWIPPGPNPIVEGNWGYARNLNLSDSDIALKALSKDLQDRWEPENRKHFFGW